MRNDICRVGMEFPAVIQCNFYKFILHLQDGEDENVNSRSPFDEV